MIQLCYLHLLFVFELKKYLNVEVTNVIFKAGNILAMIGAYNNNNILTILT